VGYLDDSLVSRADLRGYPIYEGLFRETRRQPPKANPIHQLGHAT